MKRKIFYIILIFLSVGLLLLGGVLSLIFFRPELIVNPANLDLALKKTQVLKSWSWREAKIDIIWNKYNDRRITGHFYDFCLEYESDGIDVQTCLEEISWDLNIGFRLKDGVWVKNLKPLIINSRLSKIAIKDNPEEKTAPSPPEVWKYWQMLWSQMIPDMIFSFNRIELLINKNKFFFDLNLRKLQQKINAEVLGFKLIADPKKIELIGPSRYLLPWELIKGHPLLLKQPKLTAIMKEEGIPLAVTGSLEVLDFIFNAHLDLPNSDEINSVSFKRSFLSKLSGQIILKDIQQKYLEGGLKKYPALPAPINVLDGSIITDIRAKSAVKANIVKFDIATHLHLKSDKQILDMGINVLVPLNVETFSPGSLSVDIKLNKVLLHLPRISKKLKPPQFIPDRRIVNGPFGPKSTPPPGQEKKTLDLTMHLSALADNALHFKTNLLDEDLRLNFDLLIDSGNLKSGFIQVLPLKTKVFKRPIHVKSMKINFDNPTEPLLDGVLYFPLPEYKITLNLEGPVSDPRHSFSSQPPLSQNDIFAVLLFGRPMAELDPEDKTGAQKTNQLLAQGILSLGVLYFLAGSPVEFIGYDPDTKSATAQIGLGSKTSLRVGGGSEKANSTGVRRSLGKGWFLDTSAQSSSSLSESNTRSYGVMLERIIAY